MESKRDELRRLIRNKRSQRLGNATPSRHMPDPVTTLLAAGVDDANVLQRAPALVEAAKKMFTSTQPEQFLNVLSNMDANDDRYEGRVRSTCSTNATAPQKDAQCVTSHTCDANHTSLDGVAAATHCVDDSDEEEAPPPYDSTSDVQAL
jgi:hypothetical protein